jgi:two-component system alkaline phosphatase synthesis response regulator PhoP
MSKRVLIIDDDANIATCLSLVLGARGYESESAGDGAEGQRKIRRFKPDLIILDVMMPNKSGLLLFEELKQAPPFRDTPVLMLTGAAEAIDEVASHEDEALAEIDRRLRGGLQQRIRELRESEDGPEAFLSKPVDPDRVIAEVERLIGR